MPARIDAHAMAKISIADRSSTKWRRLCASMELLCLPAKARRKGGAGEAFKVVVRERPLSESQRCHHAEAKHSSGSEAPERDLRFALRGQRDEPGRVPQRCATHGRTKSPRQRAMAGAVGQIVPLAIGRMANGHASLAHDARNAFIFGNLRNDRWWWCSRVRDSERRMKSNSSLPTTPLAASRKLPTESRLACTALCLTTRDRGCSRCAQELPQRRASCTGIAADSRHYGD